MIHTVLRVKATSGEGSVFIAAIIALAPAIRIMDAQIIVNLVIIDNKQRQDMNANNVCPSVNNVWTLQHVKHVKKVIMLMVLA